MNYFSIICYCLLFIALPLMGEHPDLEFILDYKIKSSTLREVNSENLCADTEE